MEPLNFSSLPSVPPSATAAVLLLPAALPLLTHWREGEREGEGGREREREEGRVREREGGREK